MKIKTQFIITTIIFAMILVAISTSVILTNQQLDQTNRQRDIARNLQQEAYELSYLTNDYLLYRESQQLTRWKAKFASFSDNLARLAPGTAEQQELVNHIRANQSRLGAVFADISVIIESAPQADLNQAFMRVAWSRMEFQSQAMIFDASGLAQMLRDQADQLIGMRAVLMYVLLGVFGAFLFVNGALTYRRMLRSIAQLQAGTRVIGSGNLDYAIPTEGKDEIGELSRAFNQMTASLREIMASKADLEREMAERKRAEIELAHLASFPDLNPFPVLELDVAGNVKYLNPASRRLFPDLPVQGSRHPFLAGWEGMANSLRSGEAPSITRDVRVGDSWYEQLVFCVPSRQDFRLYSRDITERKKTEEIKDEFIGMVSHELKTPLTVIIGALSVVTAEGINQEEVRELIRDAQTSADSLADIVDNLLELSRYQANRLALQTERADLDAVARRVLRALQTRSAIHRLTRDIPSGLPSVVIDSVRIERVLHNLVENAIKYSPEGGEVRVFARPQDTQLVVGVSDQGIGISPEDRPRLFQSFERIGAYAKNSIPGLGLGLRVCRILVEAHGGRIWIESERGKGSTFFFALPMAGEGEEAKS